MGYFSLNYASVLEMVARQSSRVVELDAAGFIILLDLLNELAFRSSWKNDGAELTDLQWDVAQNWVAVCATALMTIYECEEGEEPGDEMSFAIIRDEKSSGTHGGSSTSTTYVQRDLNTIVTDLDNIVSALASNAFTPIAGTFRLRAAAPARSSAAQRIRLYNVTQASIVKEGQNAFAIVGSVNHAYVDMIIVANGTDSFRIDHYVYVGVASSGFGLKQTLGTNEVYTSVLLELLP